jgi:hypothetical protein
MGALEHTKRPFIYSVEANKIVGQELFRIIEDLGYFDKHPLLKLALPSLGLQFQTGSIVKWHKRPGKWVNEGEDLFDIRVEEIKRVKRVNAENLAELADEETTTDKWSWVVRVTSADTVFFRKQLVPVRGSCSVGDLLGVFSVRDNERVNYDELSIDDAPTLRVVAHILESAE